MKKKMISAVIAGALLSGSLLAAGTANADVYYKNCDAARAANVTPLYESDPGYAPHLDRDNDGIACESQAQGGITVSGSSRSGSGGYADIDEGTRVTVVSLVLG